MNEIRSYIGSLSSHQLTPEAIAFLHDLILQMLERLVVTSGLICGVIGKRTLCGRSVQTAVRIHLCGSLGTSSVSAATQFLCTSKVNHGLWVRSQNERCGMVGENIADSRFEHLSGWG